MLVEDPASTLVGPRRGRRGRGRAAALHRSSRGARSCARAPWSGPFVRLVDVEVGPGAQILDHCLLRESVVEAGRERRPVLPTCARRAASARGRRSATSSSSRRRTSARARRRQHLSYLGDATHRRRASTSARAPSPATTTGSAKSPTRIEAGAFVGQRHDARRARHGRRGRLRRRRQHRSPRTCPTGRAGARPRAPGDEAGLGRAAARAAGQASRKDSSERPTPCAASSATSAARDAVADHPRRPAPARVPRLRLGRHRRRRRTASSKRRRAAGKLGNLADGPRRASRSPGDVGHRPHALGHPRPPDRGERASPHRTARAASSSSTTASSRTTSSSRTRLQAAGHRFRSETDTEVIAHLVERRTTDGLARGGRARAALARAARRRTRSCVLHRGRAPTAWWRARHGPAARDRARRGRDTSSPPTSRRSCAHTRDVVFLEDGEIATVTPRRRARSPTLDGTPVERAAAAHRTGTRSRPRRAATSTSCSRRSTSSRARSRDTLRGRVSLEDGDVRPRRASGLDAEATAQASSASCSSPAARRWHAGAGRASS